MPTQEARRPISEHELLKQRREFHALLDLIGHKAATKFKTVTQCFRMLDVEQRGLVSRPDIYSLFRRFHLPEDYADKFFDYMDVNGNDELSYTEVTRVIGNYIQPGYMAERTAPVETSNLASKTPEQRKQEAELRQLAEIIGSKASAKYKSLRECFRFVDEDKDGTVSRQECVRFMESFGFPISIGQRVFSMLQQKSQLMGGVEDEEVIDYATFINTFGPYIQPGYNEVLLNQRQAAAQKMQKQRSGSFAPAPRVPNQGAEQRRASARPTYRIPGQQNQHRRAAAHMQVRGVSVKDDHRPKTSGSQASTESGFYEAPPSEVSSSVPSSAGQVGRARPTKAGPPARRPMPRGRQPSPRPSPRDYAEATPGVSRDKKVSWSKNYDSSNAAQRMFYQQQDAPPQTTSKTVFCGPIFADAGEGEEEDHAWAPIPPTRNMAQAAQQRSGSAADLAATVKPPPGPPGRQRPQTAKARLITQQKHQRSVEVAAGAVKKMHQTSRFNEEDSRSTCEPGTPKEAWSRRIQHARRMAEKQDNMSVASSASLCSLMNERWGAIA